MGAKCTICKKPVYSPGSAIAGALCRNDHGSKPDNFGVSSTTENKKCRWYEGCGYPSLRSIARAVKTLSTEAGPIGVRPRNWQVGMKDSIGYRSEEMPASRHAEERTYTAEIEGIGEAQAEDVDLLLDELRRKISEVKG